MSALQQLPRFARDMVARQDSNLRADLAIIPAAEAAGWQVSFQDSRWSSPANFKRNGEMVWQVRRGWSLARLADGAFSQHQTFSGGADALRLALGLQVAA